VGFGFVTDMRLFVLRALDPPRLLGSLLNVGTTSTIHWLQNVGILLVIISVTYTLAIRDPFRCLFISFLRVAGRSKLPRRRCSGRRRGPRGRHQQDRIQREALRAEPEATEPAAWQR